MMHNFMTWLLALSDGYLTPTRAWVYNRLFWVGYKKSEYSFEASN